MNAGKAAKSGRENRLAKKILYFSCQSGISGDMTVAALLDLGLDKDDFLRRLDALALDGYAVDIGRRNAGAIDACDFSVNLTKHEHVHRNLGDIEKIISESGLAEQTKDLSLRIFRRLADAEAEVHGVPVEEIHFHEVGAIDSIVDIVGAAICMTMIGADEVVASPVPFGTGHVKSAHGPLPVPVPATVEILKGAPVYQTEIKGELVTPTGAAIVRTLADRFGPMPSFELEATGYGAGKKKFEIPNALRVFLGRSAVSEEQGEEIEVLETNIDDMNPEIYSYLVPLLIERGALDAFLTTVSMKKGRPAVLVTVLCRPEDRHALESILFSETTTLGIRSYSARRSCLKREIVTIDTRFGPVKAKAAYSGGRRIRIACEYEECRRIAADKGLPLREVYELLTKDIQDDE
jgi:uncharacterized protein (TIGR00299 family) protein